MVINSLKQVSMASWLSAFMNGPEDGEYEASAAAEAGDNLVWLAHLQFRDENIKQLNHRKISRSITLAQAILQVDAAALFKNIFSTTVFIF